MLRTFDSLIASLDQIYKGHITEALNGNEFMWRLIHDLKAFYDNAK